MRACDVAPILPAARLAETMSRQRCALVMVEQRDTGRHGPGRLFEVLADVAVAGTPR